jgi:hypothetical protein
MDLLKIRQFANGAVYENKEYYISLINPCNNTNGKFEIICLAGDLFKGELRFNSLDQAEDYINYMVYRY